MTLLQGLVNPMTLASVITYVSLFTFVLQQLHDIRPHHSKYPDAKHLNTSTVLKFLRISRTHSGERFTWHSLIITPTPYVLTLLKGRTNGGLFFTASLPLSPAIKPSRPHIYRLQVLYANITNRLNDTVSMDLNCKVRPHHRLVSSLRRLWAS